MFERKPPPLEMPHRVELSWMLSALQSQYEVVKWLHTEWRRLDFHDLYQDVEEMQILIEEQDRIIKTQEERILKLEKKIGQIMGKIYGKSSKYKY